MQPVACKTSPSKFIDSRHFKHLDVRQQTVGMFVNVDKEMATAIGDNVGVNRPEGTHVDVEDSSPALSMTNSVHGAKTQTVAVLIGDGFPAAEVQETLETLKNHDVMVHVVSDKLGTVTGTGGMELPVDATFVITHPGLFDSYYVVGGKSQDNKMFEDHVREFTRMAYKFFKPIGVASTGASYLEHLDGSSLSGVIQAAETDNFPEAFVEAIAQQRFWDRL